MMGKEENDKMKSNRKSFRYLRGSDYLAHILLSIYGIEWCVLCVFGAESSDAYFGANG